MEKNVRLQFEVTPNRLQELEVLMRTCDLSTKKELFNNALTLLEWAVKERAQGYTIASICESAKKLRELQMPVLSAAARNGDDTCPDGAVTDDNGQVAHGSL